MSDVAYDPNGNFNAGYNRVSQFINDVGRRRAGRSLSSGDYGGASRSLYEAGDLEGGQQIQAQGQAADTAKKARELEATLRIARALRGVRQQGGDVVSALDGYRPILGQMGVDDAQYGQIRTLIQSNPQALDQIEQLAGQQQRELQFRQRGPDTIVLDPTTGALIQEYKATPQDYTLGDARFSGATNQPVAQAPRDPEYIQRDPQKDLVEIPGAPPRGGASAPRGVRNNNPGNIEDGPFARSLPGYAGSDGRFAIFSTPEAGSQAAPRLLESYISRGFDTPLEIITRWAPPSDNNPTQAYAAYVANRLGIAPGDKVTREQIPALAQAIREFENGERPTSAASSTPRVVSAGQPNSSDQVRLLSDDEKRSLGLPTGGAYQQGSDGRISAIGGSNERFTQDQRQAAGFTFRLQNATRTLDRLATQGITRPSPQILLGDGTINRNIRSESDRRFLQAAKEWLAPVLRRDTGAAVTDGELVTYGDIYIPMPTDSPAVIAQKAEARRVAEQALRGQAGAAYDELLGTVNAGQSPQGPRTRFSRSPQQDQFLQRSPQNREERVGQRGNPYFLNPRDPNSGYANVPRGSYYVTPDGVLRGPKT